ncbi:hypothetical protein N9B82_04710 [Saprospiraceae bacterium]|nr:hypothetical protein [Saprospiraceae bacterium]
MKKSIKIFFLLISVLSMYGCVNIFKLSDLQSNGYKFPNNIDKAKLLLQEMGVAHKIHMWDSIDTYNVIFEDEFYGFLGKKSSSFKEPKMTFSMNFIPKVFTGQLEILSGKEKGDAWGIQSWETYRINAIGEVEMQNNKNAKFYIPTYQYFIEFPLRIQEASVVDYMGEKIVNGRECEGVIASWNIVSPQKEIDQYVIWLDSQSKRIVKIEYTVRDKYKFVSGAANFEEYKDYSGFIFPSQMPVETNLLKEGYLHKMSIVNFTPNKLSSSMLKPLN